MSKKRVLGLASFLNLLPFVSAQAGYGNLGSFFETGMRDLLDGAVGFARPVLEAVIGDYSGGEFFFAKVLLLILLFVIIFAVSRRLPFLEERRQKPVALIIALVVSILAVRFISESQMVLGVLLPYGVLGVAITVVIPFLLFFYIIHIMGLGTMGRRLFWILFIIVFAALWVSRYSELPMVANQIYIWTFVVMVIAFIADKGIHRYFAVHEINIFMRGANQRTIANLQAEYYKISGVPTRTAEKRRDAIRRELEELGGELP